MGILKRSFISLTKKKGRTLILLLVIFLIGNVIAGAVSIYNASNQVESLMKKQLGAQASIAPDYSKMNFEDNTLPPSITPELADKVAELPQVESVNYEISTMLGSGKLKKYEGENGGMMAFGGYMDHTLKASNNELPADFQSGKKQIIDGQLPSSTNVKDGVAVSKEFAEKNKLKVGDKITLEQGLFPPMKESESGGMTMAEIPEADKVEEVTFTITGIFQTEAVDKNSTDMMAKFNAEMDKNAMYTTTDIVNTLINRDVNYQIEKGSKYTKEQLIQSVSPIYTLKSIDDIDSFVEDAKALLDNDMFSITTSKDSYESVASSITNMKSLSSTVLIFGTLGSILILLLVLTLFLRDRKHEFGLYNALGESRISTCIQVVIEVVVVAAFAVSLALFSGNVLAKNMSTNMIENAMKQDDKQENNMGGMTFAIGGGSSLPTLDSDDVINNYKVELTSEYVIAFYGLMMGASIVASLASTIYILRLKPRKILL